MATRTLGTAVGSVFNAVGSIADTTSNMVVGMGSFVDAMSNKAEAYAQITKDQADYAKARSRKEAELRSALILKELLQEVEDANQSEDDQRLFNQALEIQKTFFEKKPKAE